MIKSKTDITLRFLVVSHLNSRIAFPESEEDVVEFAVDVPKGLFKGSFVGCALVFRVVLKIVVGHDSWKSSLLNKGYVLISLERNEKSLFWFRYILRNYRIYFLEWTFRK